MKLEKNVEDVLLYCSELSGKAKHQRFKDKLLHGCEFIKSPIERLFYISFKTLCDINGMDGVVSENINGVIYHKGIIIQSQRKIGNYYVDFLISHVSCKNGEELKTVKYVIVELDGHEFHDKNKHQRKYEKERDRYLQSHGYPVFHYTGSEVVSNATKIAVEVFCFITGMSVEFALRDSGGLFNETINNISKRLS